LWLSYIRVTAEGTGYTAAPTVSFSSGTAAATALIQATTCVLIKQQFEQFPEDDPRFSLFLLETRVYHTLPGPTLTQWQFQERIEKYVKIDKQLVLKSTVPADPNDEALADGVTIEYQDLTAVYSAKITTTVPADIAWENDGEDFIYEATVSHRFPDQITEDPVIIVAFLLNSNGVAIDYGWDVKVEEGYAGPCRAVITERYTFDPTDAAFIAALPAPTQVFPKAQTIFIRSYGLDNGRPIADVQSFVVPMTLHPILTVDQDVNGTVQDVTIDVTPPLDATVPTGFSTGDSMLIVTEPQRVGIGKLWVCRFIEIFHP
jgi:hypothetical protein